MVDKYNIKHQINFVILDLCQQKVVVLFNKII